MTKRSSKSDGDASSRKNSMQEKLKRTKTGCLTCRTRRVKCDERKPVCNRCEIANLECAGYEGKRRLPIKRPRRSVRDVQAAVGSTSPIPNGRVDVSHTSIIRADGLPLVGLPVNPTPSQRPHTRARDILAYHQFIFRTLPTIFPFDKDHVWRDYLCEAAWEDEYIYDAIVALGGMHRATLLLSRDCKNDQHRGLDTKVISIQNYTRAFQGLAEALTSQQTSKILVVGTLVLFAYFEAFDGNIPAAMRHHRMAHYYFNEIYSEGTYHQNRHTMAPLISALNDLDLVACVVMPLPSTIDPNPQLHAHSHVDLYEISNKTSSASPTQMLQYLLDISSAEFIIKQLIWSPTIGYCEEVSVEKILAFIRLLEKWWSSYETTFQKIGMEALLENERIFNLETLDNLDFPPGTQPTVCRDYCLVLALYAFYRGRLSWKLSLLNHEASKNELQSYYYFYQVLKLFRTVTESPPALGSAPQLPCEALGISITPMLFLIGHCCPNPSWLQWIIEKLRQNCREGLYSPRAFAKVLECLLSLEKCVKQYSGSRVVERFSVASSRIIALPVPDASGRMLVTFYAQPPSTSQVGYRNSDIKQNHYPLCVAKWSCSEAPPDIETFANLGRPFDEEWLLDQPLIREWVEWSHVSGFDLDQALRDHMNGSELFSKASS